MSYGSLNPEACRRARLDLVSASVFENCDRSLGLILQELNTEPVLHQDFR